MRSALVRISGSVFQLLLSLAVAHYFGTATVGRFLVFVAATNLFVAVGGGLPNLLMRYASLPADRRRPGYVGWLWRHSLTLAGCCLVFAVVAGLVAGAYTAALGVAAAVLLVQRNSSAVLKARGQAALGVLLDAVLYPVAVLSFVLVVHAIGWRDVDESLRAAYIGSVALAALIALALSWRDDNSVRRVLDAPGRTPRTLFAEIGRVTIGAASGVVATQAPLVLAPFILTDEETGSLGLALRVAGFATTLLFSLNAYFGPAFTRAGTAAELLALRRQSQRACLLLYLPILVVFIAFPRPWLELVDPGLGAAKPLVVLLSVGYLVNAATGLCQSILVMRGHAKRFARVIAAGAWATVLGVVLGGVLGGVTGLAIGLSITMALSNLYVFHVSTQVIHGRGARPQEGVAEETASRQEPSPVGPSAADA